MKEVRRAIDEAETSFRSCWKILCCLKERAPEIGTGLLDFQPTLADALFNLEHIYNQLVNYRDFLIDSRRNRSRTALSNRLRLLDRYKSALEEVMV